MPATPTASCRTALLAGVAGFLVLAALGTWLLRQPAEDSPRDCALTPSSHHTGTFQNWRLSMSPGEGMSGEVSAAIKLDDGREIVAYNVTNAGGLSPGDKVTVSEIQCIHRRVFLIQAGGG
jgi:hypothetical protein